MAEDRLQALLAFFAEDPTDEFTCFALASEYRIRGDLGAARFYFERLAQDSPDYVGTYYHLGKLLEELKESETAREVYERGIRVADRLRDNHAKAELQSALLDLQGIDLFE